MNKFLLILFIVLAFLAAAWITGVLLLTRETTLLAVFLAVIAVLGIALTYYFRKKKK